MSTPSEEKLIMEIEVKLLEDKSGVFRDSLRRELKQQCVAIDSQLKAGAPPDEYKRLGKIKNGLESADAILERLWLFHHGAT